MNTLYFTNRDDWRVWLQANHATESEVFFVFYKKASGKPSVPYEQAVEEALCFGWIDGVQRSLDAERYALRFTPRKPKSNWSDSNKRRVRKLIAEGLMTEAGMSKITFDLNEVPVDERA